MSNDANTNRHTVSKSLKVVTAAPDAGLVPWLLRSNYTHCLCMLNALIWQLVLCRKLPGGRRFPCRADTFLFASMQVHALLLCRGRS